MYRVLLLALLLVAPAVGAQTTDTPEALHEALIGYVGPFTEDVERLTWQTDWADLNADGLADALIYLSGPDWCGSQGCTLLVFEAISEEDAVELGPYRPAAEISMVSGPVLVSELTTNAWCDLVAGGTDGALHTLVFDGTAYPMSPEDGAPLQTATLPDGQLLFADAQ